MGYSNTFRVAAAAAALLTPLALANPVRRDAVAKVASSYFAGFHATAQLHSPAFAVDQIDWTKYTDVKWAFAETTACGDLNLSGSAPELIPSFVEAAHKHVSSHGKLGAASRTAHHSLTLGPRGHAPRLQGKNASISVGGWSGSQYFSWNFGNAANRTNFVQKCLDLVKKYNLDGLDFE